MEYYGFTLEEYRKIKADAAARERALPEKPWSEIGVSRAMTQAPGFPCGITYWHLAHLDFDVVRRGKP